MQKNARRTSPKQAPKTSRLQYQKPQQVPRFLLWIIRRSEGIFAYNGSYGPRDLMAPTKGQRGSYIGSS
nr:hypothetical protein Q903MT_gene152 [Picea sitchensis]